MTETNLIATVQPIEVQARVFMTQVEQFNIETQIDNEKACSLLSEVVNYRKSGEAQKKELEKPYKDKVKEISDKFKSPLDFLNSVETSLRQKINAFLDTERKRIEKALAEEKRIKEEEALKKALELEAQKKDADKYDGVTKNALIQTLEESQNKIINDTAKVQAINLSSSVSSVRMIWDFNVVDIQHVPTEFLQVNEKAIREAIRNGARDISGLEIFQKSSVAIK